MAFVGGLGVGDPWLGNPGRGFEPWRDTGVEIRGPAVADLSRAFSDNWTLAGGAPVPETLVNFRDGGDARVRVITTEPAEAGLYRLDTLIAAVARETLWLTDAYFVATNGYVQALAAAARDGVDVRLLLPGTSDLPLVRAVSVIGYRPLLEAGVRIFEWNGTMLHAKTAVADGSWTRIGSSNLNPVCWWGNWELDVAIEDERFAGEVADMFERDLRHSTEIVLDVRHRMVRSARRETHGRRRRRRTARAVAGAVGLSSTVGAALTNRRALAPTAARVLAAGGILQALRLAKGASSPVLTTVNASNDTTEKMKTADLARVSASGSETAVTAQDKPAATAVAGTSQEGEVAASTIQIPSPTPVASTATQVASASSAQSSTNRTRQSSTNRTRTRLPQTASPAPLMAMVGSFALMTAGALRTLRDRISRRKVR